MGAILRDSATGYQWRFDEGDSWVIGRSADCEVRLDDAAVGRHHARIEFCDGGWRVVDHHTTNGTSVNGVLVTDREELRWGDVLAVGSLVACFECDGRPPRLPVHSSRREEIALPQTFEALTTLFSVLPRDVDGALVVARSGEALLRFAASPERRPALVDAYKAALKSEWPVVRAVAMHGLTATLGAGGVYAGELSGLLTHQEEDVRVTALRALATLDPLSAAPRLLARAMEALEAGKSPGDAAERTADLARAGDGALLDSLRARAESCAFDSSDTWRRCCAAAALGEIAASGTREAVRTLRALTGSGEEASLRLHAARALARAGGPEAQDALIQCLADPSPMVFHAATRALSGIADPRIVARLVDALHKTPAEDIAARARYRRALEDVTGERRGPDPSAWLRG